MPLLRTYITVHERTLVLSQHVLVVQSRTFAFQLLQINFRVANRQIDLEKRKCKLRDNTRVPCADIEVTMKYDVAPGVPEQIG